MRSFIYILIFIIPMFVFAKTKDLILKVDDKWHVDYTAFDGPYGIQEMTIEGENVNNWSELITIQKIPLSNKPLKDLYSLVIQGLQSTVYDGIIQHHLIDQDETSIFFEWWIDHPSRHAQHEWQRLIKSDVDLFIVRYTTKKLDTIETVRTEWEERLLNAHLGSVDDLLSSNFEKVEFNGLETKPFIDSYNKYSVQVPINWESFTVKDKDEGPSSITHLFKVPNNEGSLVLGLSSKEKDITLKEHLDQQIELFSKELHTEFIRYEKMMLPKSGETLYAAVLGPQKINEEIVVNIFLCYLYIDDQVAMFYATAPLDVFDEQVEIFKAIVPTIAPL
jgi:hypothetical protein